MTAVLEVVGPWFLAAIAALLVLLRLQARRFGVKDPERDGDLAGHRAWVGPATWYAMSLGLILLAYALYPLRISHLHLGFGADRAGSLVVGIAIGLAGSVAAVFLALRRDGTIRLPASRAWPVAVVRILLAAVIDEAAFRGIVLGLIVSWGWGDPAAILGAALVYALATRVGAPGRSPEMLLGALSLGILCGISVVVTGGIAAAIVGHAITRFTLFLATGSIGEPRPVDRDPEAREAALRPPDGWAIVEAPPIAADPGAGRPRGLQPPATQPPTLAWVGPRVDVAEAPWVPPASWAVDPARLAAGPPSAPRDRGRGGSPPPAGPPPGWAPPAGPPPGSGVPPPGWGAPPPAPPAGRGRSRG